MKFGPVTPELTELIFWRTSDTTRSKTSVFSRISPDILDQFSQYLHHYESALDADDGSVPYFSIWQGTLPWQPNNFAVMKAD